jgi:glutamine amidotransferase
MVKFGVMDEKIYCLIMARIIIIDYGMGNIRSVVKKINQTDHEVIVSNNIADINTADKLILPGVGHFSKGMQELKKRNIINALNIKVLEEKTPILGICLGMQLLTSFSEEGHVAGLGWVDAETIKFELNDIRYKVPHMGWNSVHLVKESPLFKSTSNDGLFYFVHSFYVKCNNSLDILAITQYKHDFVSAIQKGNIFGTQFHPEKSHEWGERMLLNFINL